MARWQIAAIALLAALGFATSAHAQWLYDTDEDAFSEEVLHLSLVASGSYALGFRCTDVEDLEVLYITPELSDAETIQLVNAFAPELLFRVDSNTVIRLNAEAVLSMNGAMALISDDDGVLSVAQQTISALTRIAVSSESLGERFHTNDMPVRGSTTAITRVLEGCGIQTD